LVGARIIPGRLSRAALKRGNILPPGRRPTIPINAQRAQWFASRAVLIAGVARKSQYVSGTQSAKIDRFHRDAADPNRAGMIGTQNRDLPAGQNPKPLPLLGVPESGRVCDMDLGLAGACFARAKTGEDDR
jgi:hypothetical protein